MFPPIVDTRWLAGSGAKKRPVSRAAALIWRLGTPGSTSAVWPTASIARIRRRRDVVTTSAQLQAIVPPERPVPAPRGTTATPARDAAFTHAAVSSAVPGTTTAIGGWRSHPPAY